MVKLYQDSKRNNSLVMSNKLSKVLGWIWGDDKTTEIIIHYPLKKNVGKRDIERD